MEDKQTRKLHFNIFDLLILLLAAAVGVGVLALRNRAAGTDVARETVPMRCTVEFIRVVDGMEEAMHPGDSVFRSTDGAYFGKIVDVSSVPHKEVEYAPALGQYVEYEAAEYSDIYVVVESECYATERELVFGSVPVKIGAELPVKGRGFARVGYAVALDTMGAALPENTAAGVGGCEAVYTLLFEDARSFYEENIHLGDRFYEPKTGTLLGTVEALSVRPHEETALAPDGTASVVAKPGRYDLTVTLRGRFVDKADGYYLDGGAELKVGASIAVESRTISRTGVFAAIESVEGVA